MHRSLTRLMASLCLACSLSVRAAGLDTTFGVNGYATLEAGGVSIQAIGAILQTDDKIVVIGISPAFSYSGLVVAGDSARDIVVARFNANGALDTAFASQGVARIDFNAGDDRGYAVAQQADGKLVIVGSSVSTLGDTDFAVARLNVNGTLDGSFGQAGRVEVNFPCISVSGGVQSTQARGDDLARAVLVQADGKLLVGGANCNSQSLALIRLLANGDLDPAYGLSSGPYGPGRISSSNLVSPLSSMTFEAGGGVLAVIPGGFSPSFTQVLIQRRDQRAHRFLMPADHAIRLRLHRAS